MNRLITAALCAAALFSTSPAGAAELTIHIDDVKAANGNLMVALYSSSATFLKKPDNATGAPAAMSGNKVVFIQGPAGGRIRVRGLPRRQFEWQNGQQYHGDPDRRLCIQQ